MGEWANGRMSEWASEPRLRAEFWSAAPRSRSEIRRLGAEENERMSEWADGRQSQGSGFKSGAQAPQSKNFGSLEPL